jgi:hypothetical protein
MLVLHAPGTDRPTSFPAPAAGGGQQQVNLDA